MRGPVVVLALLVTPFVATIASAQETRPVNPGDQKCAVRERGNSPDVPRTDPTQQGNKDCAPAVVGHTTISGVVFFDIDQNGVLGVDEVGLSAWQVQLIGPASTLTVMTDGDGKYSFPNLDAGTYTVCVIPPPGWNQISPTNSTPNGTSCATGGFGYTLTAPAAATDTSIPNINFGFVSQ